MTGVRPSQPQTPQAERRHVGKHRLFGGVDIVLQRLDRPELDMIQQWLFALNFRTAPGHRAPSMIKLDRQSILQIALLTFVTIGGTWILHSLGVIDLFLDRHRMLKFIHEHRAYAATVFIGLQALQVVAAPVPGEVTGFVGGYLFGTGAGIVYSTIGLTLGSWIAFMIARLLGRHLVERLLSAGAMRKYDYLMKHKGLSLAFLMYIIPGFPKDMLCYLLGLGHMSQMSFLVVSTSGRLFGTILLTVGGTYFRSERYGALFVVIGAGITVVFLVTFHRRNIDLWIRRMRLARHHRTRSERARRRPTSVVDRHSRED
jgi:uncharacterized membrane protein YdjX (TVP38/TMEM64 family)